ncbi:MAG: hypothetical protein DI573_11230 [Microbacterium sp.]|uniref:hypothetical protein n=1 Tax=Microbacterium sp. TaxID=51671 RepID=UPI000DB2A576|nr:hypothetical protein [Microbacterium sp.]PZU37637.1 MAG: hypothetical protein DI573_11230 [Microbacterium sp.]
MAHDVVAWVESPLQLIGAAEWAHAHRTSAAIAGRLTAQMPETADELLARGATFGAMAPYLGIPWGVLARHRHWLVGDGYSGQFRLAASVLRPRRITFLDDGANAVAFADTLTGRRGYSRPGVAERGLTTRIAPVALDLLHTRALAGRVDVFTAFALGDERVRALAELGIPVRSHRFEWTRASAPRATADARPTTRRVLLGSARPVDGHLDADLYLDWIAAEAASSPLTYLPHRRETPAQLAAVAAIPGVRIAQGHLPAELVLAGAEGLDVLTLASSTTTTLPLVLDGTGSRIRERVPGQRHRRRALR